MTNKLLVLVILLLISSFGIVSISSYVFAQSAQGESFIANPQDKSVQDESADTAWVRRYNGPANSTDWPYDMAVDHSGDVYVTGFSMISGISPDVATIKYYPDGDTAWVRTYNGPTNGYDVAYAIAVDDSGYVYVTGSSYDDSTMEDYLTIKYSPSGDTIWARRYTGTANSADIAYDIAVDDSGNVYVTGGGFSGWNDEDFITIKYHSNGDTAWVRKYNGPDSGYDRSKVIAVDGSGNVYVTGWSPGIGTEVDYATIKYYPDGDTAWVRRYDGQRNGSDMPYDMAVDDWGNVYVTGVSQAPYGSYADYATVKYDPSGSELWVRGINVWPCSTSYARALAIDGSNNVYVTGYFGCPSGGATVKYYPNGDTAWVRKYRSSFGVDLAVDLSGNVYVAGDNGFDFAVIKYNANGDSIWTQWYDGPAGGEEQFKATAVDDSGNVYVAGMSFGIGTDIDYATIKYVQFLRGDINRDGVVELGDIVYLITYLYKNGPSPIPILQAGDVNCDGVVQLGDLVYLINYIYKGGTLPCK